MQEQSDSKAQFHPTRWSVVHRVQSGGDDAARALEELCREYWFPLYGWARRSGMTPSDAEDAVQGFFADVIRKQLFQKAEETRGRLRSFLLTVFRRYLADQREKASAAQRGGGRVFSFDALAGEELYLAEGSVSSTPDAFYDRQWALTVLERAMARLADDYAKRGKGADFEQLRRHLTGDATTDYAADAAALKISEGTVRVAVHRLRERFGQALREEVSSTQTEGGDVDAELTHLLRALES